MPFRGLLLIVILCLSLQIQAAETLPRVVVTLKPIHSLTAFIMQGVAEPELLVQGGQSPHSFSLRPSDMRKLHQAQLVVWVGPDVESALSTLFNSGRLESEVVQLTELPDIHWLSPRRQEMWEARKNHQHSSDHAHAHEAEIDSHIWLSPRIASQIARQLTELLAELDQAHARQYRDNGERLQQRLQRLDRELDAQLNPVKGVPYIVFHDAYHYLEDRYGLNAVGSVSINPERQPGAHHVHELRTKISHLQARCVFSEPQFRPKLVETLVEGTQAGIGQLDPLGSDLEPGPEAYFQLMHQLADNLLQCLQRD